MISIHLLNTPYAPTDPHNLRTPTHTYTPAHTLHLPSHTHTNVYQGPFSLFLSPLSTSCSDPGRRLTKKQTASRPDYLWPEIWKNMSDAAQRREKQKWAIQKSKLHNARRLRGIYFIDPADEEFKETMTEVCSNLGFLLEQCKNDMFLGNRLRTSQHGPMIWKVMQRNAERHCERADQTTHQLHKVSTPRLDDHQLKEELGSVGELSKVCSQIVLKRLYLPPHW